MKINNVAIFSNYLSIKKYLDKIPPTNKVIFDLSSNSFVDHTVMEHLHDFAHDQANNGGSVGFRGMELHQSVSSHPTSSRKQVALSSR